MPVKLTNEIDTEIEEAVAEMQDRAVRDAPVDQGILRGEITRKDEGELTWSLISQALHSPYIEFGTKLYVQVPPGLEDEAAKFRGSSQSSLSAKEAIFLWCKRHGIEERLWYQIFLSIMTKGIKPRPFFFKQLNIVKPKLIDRLNKLLSRL